MVLLQALFLPCIFIWDIFCQTNPATSSIERVSLSELDFPAVTVCPDWATDQLAIQTVYNM